MLTTLASLVQYLGLCLAPPTPVDPKNPPSTTPRSRILIISEFLARGNLRQYILDRSLPFPWRLRLSFAIDLARALAYMHTRNCMHRDLKGENLLVTENLRVKVCDFGFARLAALDADERRRMSYCGTDGYMSPEILMGDEFGLATDVFSMGVILAEIQSRAVAAAGTFARVLPSFGLDPEEVRARVSAHCPESLVELTLACVQVEPGMRPDAVQVLNALIAIEGEVKERSERGELGNERGGSWHAGSVGYAGWRRTNKADKARALPAQWSESESEGEGDEDRVEVLRNLASTVDGSQAPLLDQSGPGLSVYSTALIKAGRGGKSKASALCSTITITPHQYRPNYPSPTETLPGLPDSWIAAHKKSNTASPSEGGSTEEDSAPEPTTPELDQLDQGPFNGSTLKASQRGSGTHSALTIDSTAVTIAHGYLTHSPTGDSSSGDGRSLLQSHSASPTFYSAEGASLSAVRATPSEQVHPPTHRFSLIKPSFQRFLGSLPDISAGPSKRGSLEARLKRASVESAAARAPASPTRAETVEARGCAVCDKRIGVWKAHLECDDCAFRCHIKCSVSLATLLRD